MSVPNNGFNLVRLVREKDDAAGIVDNSMFTMKDVSTQDPNDRLDLSLGKTSNNMRQIYRDKLKRGEVYSLQRESMRCNGRHLHS